MDKIGAFIGVVMLSGFVFIGMIPMTAVGAELLRRRPDTIYTCRLRI